MHVTACNASSNPPSQVIFDRFKAVRLPEFISQLYQIFGKQDRQAVTKDYIEGMQHDKPQLFWRTSSAVSAYDGRCDYTSCRNVDFQVSNALALSLLGRMEREHAAASKSIAGGTGIAQDKLFNVMDIYPITADEAVNPKLYVDCYHHPGVLSRVLLNVWLNLLCPAVETSSE